MGLHIRGLYGMAGQGGEAMAAVVRAIFSRKERRDCICIQLGVISG